MRLHMTGQPPESEMFHMPANEVITCDGQWSRSIANMLHNISCYYSPHVLARSRIFGGIPSKNVPIRVSMGHGS